MSPMGQKSSIPVVFISSTVEDLKPYRAAARDAAIRDRFLPDMQDYFVASGDKPPLAKCLEKVSRADVLVVIVAHRFGWVPADQPGDAKSISWLECEHAVRESKEVLAFFAAENADWPIECREAYRTMAATEAGNATPELVAEVQRSVAKLTEFKRWLEARGIRATFSTPDGLRAEVGTALREWRGRHPEFADRADIGFLGRNDPRKYLEFLREQTAWIDIRGLTVGDGKAHRFPIEDLYIPLTTARPRGRTRQGDRTKPAARKKQLEAQTRQVVELQDALAYRRLVIVGDPGAGKTTFLRRIAFALAGLSPPLGLGIPDPNVNGKFKNLGGASRSFQCQLAAAFRKASPRKGAGVTGTTERGGDAPFPILIRVSELADHIRSCCLRPDSHGPTTKESPEWVVHFLNSQSAELNWGVDEAFFRDRLRDASSILLLDGLDEAPDRIERESMARLFENATHAYDGCRFVVTARPLAYTGDAVLADFQTAQIEPLDTGAIEKFLEHWCQALFPQSSQAAKRHLTELSGVLRSRWEIRQMACNPVMLTALAVLHWNERRMPEQRADLYESILTWLARSRQKRPGREPAERCLTILQHLALAMQDRPQGVAVQVSKGTAAGILAPQFMSVREGGRLQKAREFLDEEEVDSGIIVSRGGEIRFWHLTFQEYLAARAIAGQPDSAQHKLLLAGNKIYRMEWREVALLLAGVLRVKQGQDKVDGLITAILDHLPKRPSVEDLLLCAGLLSAIVQDLKPLGYEPADRRFRPLVKGMEHILITLTPREEKVIKMRFGWEGGRRYTLEEVGQSFAVTRARIGQIEAKGLRKLSH